MTTPDWMTEYQAFKTLTSHANGEFIRFYLTTGRDGITYTHSQLPDGAGLPRYSCRLTATDGAELTFTLNDWADRLDDVATEVRAWIRAHVNLRGCTINNSRYQGDPYWRTELLRDNE